MFGYVAGHYDVIIIGSGAGGGTLAHTLAPAGDLDAGDRPAGRVRFEPLHLGVHQQGYVRLRRRRRPPVGHVPVRH